MITISTLVILKFYEQGIISYLDHIQLPHCKLDPRCPLVRAHDVAQCASGQEQCRAVQGGAQCSAHCGAH